jgi:uncharacterized membrane protein YcaP (DUF421 family)
VSTSTLESIRVDVARERRHRVLRSIGLLAVASLVLVGALGGLGVRAREVTVRTDELGVRVRYPLVARGGLAVPFEVHIVRPGGFAQAVRLSMTADYLEAFDLNAVVPEPAETTASGDLVTWIFEPPTAEVLTVRFDVRVEPGVQWRWRGWAWTPGSHPRRSEMEIVLRAAVVYALLWGLLRAMGKRELAEATAFELVLLVVLGDIVQQGVTQEDMSITGAALAAGTMGLLAVATSVVGRRVPATRSLLEGHPSVVFANGAFVDETLRLLRMTADEVDEEARKRGYRELGRLEWIIVESDGKFSFIDRVETAENDEDPDDLAGSSAAR